MSKQSSSGDKNNPSKEDIVNHFNDMRNQQRDIAEKITEFNLEIKEHDVVLDALSECDSSRKCFRQIGGILVERTVAEVIPALKTNTKNIEEVVSKLTKELENKGAILNEYREKYGVRLQGEQAVQKKKEAGEGDSKAAASGVLVA